LGGEKCCIMGTKVVEYPFMWELWRELMCNLKDCGIVETYLQWAIWVAIISMYKLLKCELWNWKEFILWGYELRLRIAIIQLLGSREKLEWIDSSRSIV
jgi:hypothetical protein